MMLSPNSEHLICVPPSIWQFHVAAGWDSRSKGRLAELEPGAPVLPSLRDGGFQARVHGLKPMPKNLGFATRTNPGAALTEDSRPRCPYRVERRHTGAKPPESVELATHPEKAPAYLAQAVLGFNEQVERILEVVLVLMVGVMLAPKSLNLSHLLFVPVLLLVIRPVAVLLGLLGSPMEREQRLMISWFGIRGIGSLLYLRFVIRHEVPEEIARVLLSVTLWVIAVSVVVHGISVTGLMNWYRVHKKRAQ